MIEPASPFGWETSEGWISLVMRMRERRNSLFGRDLFVDPAWDILLRLASDANTEGVTGDGLALDIKLSPNVTCRWLRILVDRGHVERTEDGLYRLSSSGRTNLSAIVI